MSRHPIRFVGSAASALVAVVAMGVVAPAPSPAGAEMVVLPTLVEVAVTPSGWSSVGDAVTIAATVATPDGASRVPATGSVQFLDFSRGASATLGEAPLVDGAAQLVATALAPGRHELAVRYTGSTSLRPQMRAVIHDVLPAVACPADAVDGHPAVVRLVYMELLGRCPDREGFAYWVGRLDRGTAPEVFAGTIARTPEAVGRVVDDGYRTMLGRTADRPGRAFWVRRLLRHGRYDQLLADLGSSDEFWTRGGGTDQGFVVRVYDRILGRAPDTRGLDYWLDRYATGASRRALILALANEDEPLGRLVTLAHYEILDRAPTPGEQVAGVADLRRTGDRSGLYGRLIGRPEFVARAQTFPDAGRGM